MHELNQQLKNLNEHDLLQEFENPYIAIQEPHDQHMQEPEKFPVLEPGEIGFLVLHSIHVAISFLH